MEVLIDINLQVCSNGVPHPCIENPLGNFLKFLLWGGPHFISFLPLEEKIAGKLLEKRKYIVVK